MSQRIKWFSAKTYKDRGCPIQVFVNQDISRMYSILRRILFSCLDIFGILYEILLEKQPILGKNSQRKRKPSMLFSTQRAQNLTLIKRLAKRDTIAHTDISPWNISSYEFVLCLLCLVHNEDGLWCKDMQRHYEQKDKSRLEFPSTLAQKQISYQILAFLRALSSQNIIFLGNC